MNTKLNLTLLLLVAVIGLAQAQDQPEAESPAFNFQKEFAYNVDFDSNLPSFTDKLSALSFNKSALVELFAMDGVASTPLGRVTAWIGDTVYPVALAAIFVFGVYLMLNIAFQVLGVALAGKVGVFGSLWQWLQALQSALISKVSNLTDIKGDDEGRAAAGYPSLTDIVMMAKQVGDAVDKYSQE